MIPQWHWPHFRCSPVTHEWWLLHRMVWVCHKEAVRWTPLPGRSGEQVRGRRRSRVAQQSGHMRHATGQEGPQMESQSLKEGEGQGAGETAGCSRDALWNPTLPRAHPEPLRACFQMRMRDWSSFLILFLLANWVSPHNWSWSCYLLRISGILHILIVLVFIFAITLREELLFAFPKKETEANGSSVNSSKFSQVWL